IANRHLPICRPKDESHPSCAIVHASSTLASRIGAAGYKLMRPSHEPWTSMLDLPITRAHKGQKGKPTAKATSRSRPTCGTSVPPACSPRQGQASGGANAPSLTDLRTPVHRWPPRPLRLRRGRSFVQARDFRRALRPVAAANATSQKKERKEWGPP